MNPVSNSICLGQARFEDTELARIDREEGASAAWTRALKGSSAGDLRAAAAGARGHFAVGLNSGSGHAFLAVDRFATRTLCYTSHSGPLRFAEQAGQLVGPGAEIDPQALYDYLFFHAIPAPRTVFKGVHRLQAGHAAWQDAQGTHVRRYWAPTFSERPQSFQQARTQFRAVLAQAVKAELGNGTPACFLSGGTDSSTVAGLLAQVSGSRPLSYSIGFEAEGYDEMEYARLAARHFGTEHREHYITPADLVRLIPALANHHDQPFGNSSALPTYFCALKAREEGVTKLLAGDGGDELFGGNTRYAKQRVFSWYEQIPVAMRKAVLEPLASSKLLDRVPLVKKGLSYVRQAQVPMPERLETYNLLYRLAGYEVMTPAFRGLVNLHGPEQQQRAVWEESAGDSFVNRMLAYDWRYTLAENDLPKVRCSTQLAGVEVGYPFLDQAVVDFSAQLPAHYKVKGLKLRWFMKEALRGFLPDEIITKKKHGFGLPFGVWAVRDAPLNKLAQDSLQSLGTRGIVQPAFTRQLMQDLLPQHPGYYGEMVWLLMMLEQWFLHHRPDYKLVV